jgi:sugar porter (SP) family MFS transporter
MKVYLVFICLIAAAGGFLFGFDTSVISGAIEFIASPKVFHLNAVEKGWTVGCILIGCMAGCVFTAPLSQKYGRKAVGAASMLSPMYIAEVSPARHRGKFGILNILAIFIGQSGAFFSNFALRDYGGADNWRWMMGVMVIPSGVLLLLLFFIPESPRWLVENRKNRAAYVILTRLSNKVTAEKELADIEKSVHTIKGKLSELFKRRMFNLLLIGIALAVLQQVTGINVIMYYAPSIFKSAGFGTDSALFQTAIMGLVNLTFAVLAMFFVDRMGRKPLMIIGSIGTGVSLLLLGITFITNNFHGYFVLFCIMGYLAFFGFSIGPVVWVLISEIFPNSLRSHAVAICFFCLWAADFVVSFTFPYLLSHLEGYSFLIYSFLCFLCLLFVLKYITETKGKSLEQIEKELVGNEGLGKLHIKKYI